MSVFGLFTFLYFQLFYIFNREQFLTIGKKMRDGEYGACFYPGLRSVDPCTIYSARPGSRMWEVFAHISVYFTISI